MQLLWSVEPLHKRGPMVIFCCTVTFLQRRESAQQRLLGVRANTCKSVWAWVSLHVPAWQVRTWVWRGVSQSPLTSTSLSCPPSSSLLFPSCGSSYLPVEVLQTCQLACFAVFPADSLTYLLPDNPTDNLFIVWLLLQSLSLFCWNTFCFHHSLIAEPYLPSHPSRAGVYFIFKRQVELKVWWAMSSAHSTLFLHAVQVNTWS